MTILSLPTSPGPDLLLDLQRSTDRLMLVTCTLLLAVCANRLRCNDFGRYFNSF
jgi:hypothetical protein